MVQYSNELKEEIRAANDIVDVISQYVTLKRSGRNYFGICPFHREKSPSFSVSPDRQYFHCFGCHKGGDVFTFVSEIEKLSFRETIEFLAERGHITFPADQDEGFNAKQYSNVQSKYGNYAIFPREIIFASCKDCTRIC